METQLFASWHELPICESFVHFFPTVAIDMRFGMDGIPAGLLNFSHRKTSLGELLFLARKTIHLQIASARRPSWY
jgi:hypothetical protein